MKLLLSCAPVLLASANIYARPKKSAPSSAPAFSTERRSSPNPRRQSVASTRGFHQDQNSSGK